jgi:hypothetical protein
VEQVSSHCYLQAFFCSDRWTRDLFVIIVCSAGLVEKVARSSYEHLQWPRSSRSALRQLIIFGTTTVWWSTYQQFTIIFCEQLLPNRFAGPDRHELLARRPSWFFPYHSLCFDEMNCGSSAKHHYRHPEVPVEIKSTLDSRRHGLFYHKFICSAVVTRFCSASLTRFYLYENHPASYMKVFLLL